MKTILSLLAATLLLSFSSAGMAEEPAKDARDCSKSARPQYCEAVKAAEEACNGKPEAKRWACVKAKLAESSAK